MEDELLTPEESAMLLKMHVDSVRRLLRTKKLPGVKVGGAWRIPKSSLTALLRGETAEAKKPSARDGAPS